MRITKPARFSNFCGPKRLGISKYFRSEITMAKKKTVKKAGGKSKQPGKKRAAKKGAAKKRPAKTISLGRPTVTAEEKLFMLFHEDYEARQVFEFLRAETVGDLEKF